MKDPKDIQFSKAIQRAKRVYICGNGGSAANAIHIANDLIACGIRAHALTGDVATLTAIANDFSYEQIFARQIRALGETGDVLIVLSGSGKSPNILEALRAAKVIGMETWAVVGEFNGKHCPAALLADNTMYFGADMQTAEERQLHVGHKVMKWLKSISS